MLTHPWTQTHLEQIMEQVECLSIIAKEAEQNGLGEEAFAIVVDAANALEGAIKLRKHQAKLLAELAN